jgi:hypothetical protein
VIAYFDTSALLKLGLAEARRRRARVRAGRRALDRSRSGGVLDPAVPRESRTRHGPSPWTAVASPSLHRPHRARSLVRDLVLVSTTIDLLRKPATSARPMPSVDTTPSTSPPSKPPQTPRPSWSPPTATCGPPPRTEAWPRKSSRPHSDPALAGNFLPEGRGATSSDVADSGRPSRVGLRVASLVDGSPGQLRSGLSAPRCQLPLDERFICPQDHHCRL